MYARPFIDSLDFAGNSRQIDTHVPVAALSRLQDMLDNCDGDLHYVVQGGLDNLARPILDISVEGVCWLLCQRCLHGFEYGINHQARLLLCDQASLDSQDEEEDFDGILAEAHLDVLTLLEDEILLSLPISPMHPLGLCQMAEGESANKGDRHPFSVLEKLKRN
jgi:uncharacterized protein